MKVILYKATKEIFDDIRAVNTPETFTEDEIYRLIQVELMGVGLHLMGMEIRLEAAWIVLLGYDEPVIATSENKNVLDRLRLLFSKMTGESQWKELLEFYKTINEDKRIFNWENGKCSLQEPRHGQDRYGKYKQILTTMSLNSPSKKTFLKGTKFQYEVRQDEERMIYKGRIPQGWANPKFALEAYAREKRTDLSFSPEQAWHEIAEEMDKESGQAHDERWQERMRPIEIKALKDQETFQYKDIQHIIGGLGAGKSSWVLLQTYWLVKHKQAKVGMVVGSVAEATELHRTLAALNIKTINFVGKSNRQKHLQTELQRVPKDEVIDQILTNQSLDQLSDTCLIHGLVDQKEVDKNVKPCESLQNEKGTAYLCPLASHCGVYKAWYGISEASVYITTPQALLMARAPAQVDPYKRTLYELFYSQADVVFVDEVDQVQMTFDQYYTRELDLHHPQEGVIHQFQTLANQTYHIKNSKLSKRMQDYNSLFRKHMKALNDFYNSSESLRRFTKNKVIYLNLLISSIAGETVKELGLNEGEKKTCEAIIQKGLRGYVEEIEYTPKFKRETSIFWLADVEPEEEADYILNWINEQIHPKQLAVLGPSLQMKFKLFICLAHIDQAMRFMKINEGAIQQLIGASQRTYIFSKLNHTALIKEAMTGVMFGYRCEGREGSDDLDIKVLQYSAVGRDLLFKWPHIFEHVDKVDGPAVVVLSGTSFAPTAKHYHLAHQADWLMDSPRHKPQLTQFTLLARDDLSESPICVSGSALGDEKTRHLFNLTTEIKGKIKSELAHWRSEGSHRRVLLIVNAYRDVDTVYRALEQDADLNGKITKLAREKSANTMPRSELELFYQQRDKQILIAPLLAMNRGYNILDEDNKSLFGSVFFLVRPYPTPKNLHYFIQMIHHEYEGLIEDIEAEGKSGLAAIRQIRRSSRGLLERFYENNDFWEYISDRDRQTIAWYTFIPVWQLIGRLLRGGTAARVIYADSKFFYQANGKAPAMVDYWQQFLNANQSQAFKALYGPFIESINDIKSYREARK